MLQKKEQIMSPATSVLPQVNGVVLAYPMEAVTPEALRQRACSELLRQAAIMAGLLATDDPLPMGGAMTEAASAAIEALLERELHVPEPSDEALRRHYAARKSHYASGERVNLRHVLFAVTDGVDVNALRQRAEACLIDVRCASADSADDRFARAAATLSNCPSGASGGRQGWIGAEDCAPEFAREVFGKPEVGVLPRLVHSRFGLHVVEVQARQPGVVPAFEAVRSAVMQELRQQAFATALRQFLQLLAGRATLTGVDLAAATSPLVQ
jgi:peptidyl-prolyl cis-trans isomerase C